MAEQQPVFRHYRFDKWNSFRCCCGNRKYYLHIVCRLCRYEYDHRKRIAVVYKRDTRCVRRINNNPDRCNRDGYLEQQQYYCGHHQFINRRCQRKYRGHFHYHLRCRHRLQDHSNGYRQRNTRCYQRYRKCVRRSYNITERCNSGWHLEHQ